MMKKSVGLVADKSGVCVGGRKEEKKRDSGTFVYFFIG